MVPFNLQGRAAVFARRLESLEGCRQHTVAWLLQDTGRLAVEAQGFRLVQPRTAAATGKMIGIVIPRDQESLVGRSILGFPRIMGLQLGYEMLMTARAGILRRETPPGRAGA